MKSESGIILFVALLLFASCNQHNKGESQTSLSRDSSEAYEQVKQLFPEGISESEAVQILKDLGADVSKLEKPSYVNHMLVGTMSEGDTEWMIGVSIMDGTVSGHSVNISTK